MTRLQGGGDDGADEDQGFQLVSVDPAISAVLTRAAALNPLPDPRTPVAVRRSLLEASFAQLMLSLPRGPAFDDVEVFETTVPGPERAIPVRIFRPTGDDSALPALLYFFGGGFWMRSYDSPDILGACRQIASEAHVVVVEIDYALAPEHPYPAALNEGRAVLEWMATGAGEHRIDRTRLAVGGQSSGGGLAAGLAIMARDAGSPVLCLQVLEVPGVDLSVRQFEPSHGISAAEVAAMAEAVRFYVPEGVGADDPAVSPIAVEDLSNLPPTLVVNAEYDPLRPSGERYAARLREAGVTVVSATYGGQVHNSPGLCGISAGSRAWRAQVSWAVGTMHSEGGALS